MNIIIMGTGTSNGIPAITCSCSVCKSKYKKNTRLRTSAYITGSDGTSIVIDTGPDFRIQALTHNICKLDALLVTHSHADHLHGLDDVRVFSTSFTTGPGADTKIKFASKRPPLKLYSNHQTILDIQSRFDYVFKPTQQGGGKPRIELIDVGTYNELIKINSNTKTFLIGYLAITPIPMMHGNVPVCGWKILDTVTQKTFAYLTDCNFIPENSIKLVKNADCIIIDGLREKKHPTHFCFDETYMYAKKIGAKNTWITHMSHSNGHKEIIRWFKAREKIDKKKHLIPTSCRPAWDGLKIKL